MTREDALVKVRGYLTDLLPIEDYNEVEEIMLALEQQPCGDCISRQAAKLKVARVTWDDGDSSYDFHDKCVDCLNELTPVTPQLKIGLWMECGSDEPWLKGYCCSLCNFTTTQKYDYCTCGAKMIDPHESEETDADSN